LSHLITRLEEKGWVRRERVGEDGRGYVAVLTDEGYAKVVAAAPGHVAEVRRLLFDRLSPEQLRMLDEITAAVLGGLECP